MNQSAALKIANITTVLIVVVLVLVPFQGFLPVWTASLFGHYTTWRLWDEALLIGSGLLGVALCFYDHLWKVLKKLHVIWLIAAYVLLELIIGLVAWHKQLVSAKALGYGLIVDLRFLLFFMLCLVIASKTNWLKQHWQQLLLIPALIVIVFGLLQHFVLPYDFLHHFGYGPNTILPYETVNSNLSYVRIMSTLRGANPLGTYLILVTSALVMLLCKAKTNSWRLTYALFILGALVTLYLSYSRSAWIGTLIAVLLILIIQLKSITARLWLAATTAVGIIVVTVSFIGLRHNIHFENIFFHTQQHSAVSTTSDQGHLSNLAQGLHDTIHRPLGGGVGSAGPASIYNNHSPRLTENYFIQISEEVGWLGLVLFILIYWLVAKSLWLYKADPLALVLIASLVGITLVNLLLPAWTDDTISYVWWGLAGIVLAPALKIAARLNVMSQKNLPKLIIQFLEYLVGGGVYFWSGYAIFAIGYSVFHWNWLWAKMLADAVGWTLNFFVQRYWAFNNPRLKKRGNEITSRYVIITLLNFIIDYGIVGSLKVLGISPYAGLFISSGFFTVWNYLWYRFWVFDPQNLPHKGDEL